MFKSLLKETRNSRCQTFMYTFHILDIALSMLSTRGQLYVDGNNIPIFLFQGSSSSSSIVCSALLLLIPLLQCFNPKRGCPKTVHLASIRPTTLGTGEKEKWKGRKKLKMHRVGHAVILSERHRQPIDHDWKTERRVKKKKKRRIMGWRSS